MRISLIVEADYSDLHDKDALTREKLEANLRLLAQRVEVDYRHRNGEQNKYGVFYNIYKLEAGSLAARHRADNVAQEILNQTELPLNDPKVTPPPENAN